MCAQIRSCSWQFGILLWNAVQLPGTEIRYKFDRKILETKILLDCKEFCEFLFCQVLFKGNMTIYRGDSVSDNDIGTTLTFKEFILNMPKQCSLAVKL